MPPDDGEKALAAKLTLHALSRFPADDSRGDFWTLDQIEASLKVGDRGICLGVAGIPAGYAVWRSLAETLELLNLVVFPQYRSRGYGKNLLRLVEEGARQGDFTSIWLEVRADNRPAFDLYAARGFYPVGRRRGYYRVSGPGGPEDAILMEKRL